MRGLSLAAASGGHSSSRCAGLSLSWPLLLRSTGSRCAGSAVVAHGPSRSAACRDPPRPGLEPASPALAGRLSTTAPPGKPIVSLTFNIRSCTSFTAAQTRGKLPSNGWKRLCCSSLPCLKLRGQRNKGLKLDIIIGKVND